MIMVKTMCEAQVYAVLEGKEVTGHGRRGLVLGVSLGVVFAAVVTFHLWVTWHLQRQVNALQLQVDSLVALDLNDLRSQLGDLYDLRDLNTGLGGHPTSADEDQEDNAYEDLRNSDYEEEEEEEEEFAYGNARRKRQADLSSHTEDGVPIYERGYGIAVNRTEGLRIYQSLLNGSKQTHTTTGSPIQAHHRRNSFWKEQRKGVRAQDARGRAVNDNVQFRSSRVKASGVDRTTIRPATKPTDVEKLWPASAASRNALNADERINAATAPAVLTRPVASTASTTAGDHLRKDKQHRRNGAIFKVKQPSQRLSRDPSQVQATAYKRRPSASSTRTKKRYNKKQLFSHVATAVHLVADTSNSSTSSILNQVEIASRNELGLYASWKFGDASQGAPSLIKIDGATLTVKQSGLYFIYAQVHYLDGHVINAYEVFVNTEPFLRCVTSAPALAAAEAMNPPAAAAAAAAANTCYTAASTPLREGDKLFLRDIEPMRYSVLEPSKTFFGLVRIAPIAD